MEFLKRQRLGGEGTSDEAGGESLLSQSSDFLLNEDYLILQSLWRTELNAPELLPYCQDLVDNIKQALESQQSLIDNKADEKNKDEHFTITLYQSEIERVRFLLVNYLRVRLHKLENQAHYINTRPEELEKLSEAEQRYLNKIIDINNTIIDNVIVSRLTPQARALYRANNDFEEHGKTASEKFVFCQSLEKLENIQLGEADDVVDIAEGGVVVAQYQHVSNFVQGGQMQLL